MSITDEEAEIVCPQLSRLSAPFESQPGKAFIEFVETKITP